MDSGFAVKSADEITEVTRRAPLAPPAPSVETVSPIDVSDLALSEDALELIDDGDVVLVPLE